MNGQQLKRKSQRKLMEEKELLLSLVSRTLNRRKEVSERQEQKQEEPPSRRERRIRKIRRGERTEGFHFSKATKEGTILERVVIVSFASRKKVQPVGSFSPHLPLPVPLLRIASDHLKTSSLALSLSLELK